MYEYDDYEYDEHYYCICGEEISVGRNYCSSCSLGICSGCGEDMGPYESVCHYMGNGELMHEDCARDKFDSEKL